MPNEENQESWDKYQKLILSELKDLKAGQSRLEDEVVILTNKVTKIETSEEFVSELQKVATVEQYRQLHQDVSGLNKFKNNALLMFAIMQAVIGAGMWWLTYNK